VTLGRTLRATWCVAALLAGTTVEGRAQLTIDQSEVTLSSRPADRRVAVFNVGNEGRAAINVTLEIEDWDRAENGENRFYPRGTLARTCGPRLTAFPLSIRLEPNTRQSVRLQFDGLDSLSRACWAVVFARVQFPTPPGGQRLQYVLRSGVKVYAEPADLPSDAAIEGLTVAPHEKSPADTLKSGTPTRDLVVAFRNTGGVHLMASGRVELRRPDNSVAATLPVAEFPSVPEAKRLLRLGLPALPRGHYVALALLDIGGSELLASQVEFDVP
jgi:P pilus assembly chaperone PapD